MRGYGQGPDVRFEACAGGLCVMQGNAESWPIDNSIAGRASHGVEWRSSAKAETISILRESCCGASHWQASSPTGTPGVRRWLDRQQTSSHNDDSSKATQRLLTAVFATRAPDSMLETEMSRAVHCDKDVFNCRPYERQAASMSSNFMRRNLGIPHAQGLLLGLHLLAVTSVTLDNIRP